MTLNKFKDQQSRLALIQGCSLPKLLLPCILVFISSFLVVRESLSQDIAEEQMGHLFRNVSLAESDFSKQAYSMCFFRNCAIEFHDFAIGVRISHTSLKECKIASLSISGTSDQPNLLDHVRIEDSQIGEITLDGVRVENLVIINCEISRIELRRCKIENLQIIGGSTATLVLNDLQYATGLTIWRGICDRFVVNQCVLKQLDLSSMGEYLTNLSLNQVELVQPMLSGSVAEKLDVSRLQVTSDGITVLQEILAMEESNESTERRRLLNEALHIYTILGQRFRTTGRAVEARAIDYRARLVETLNIESPWHRNASLVIGEVFNGKFGTSWTRILQAGLMFWGAFSAVYVLLGWLRRGWGMAIRLDLSGNVISGVRPRILITNRLSDWPTYLRDCCLFSLEQILVLGSRALRVSGLEDIFKPTPARYVSIGMGRYLAALENVIGIILLVNFVRVFLTTL